MEMLRNHWRKILVFVAFIALAITLGIGAFFTMTKDVTVILDKNTGNNQDVQKVTTTAQVQQTVADVLAEQGIDTNAQDYTVDKALNAQINSVDTITVKKNASGKINVGKETMTYRSTAETVGDLLKEQNVTVGSNDKVTPALDEPLTTEVESVQVTQVDIKEEKTEEVIAFSTEKQDNPELAKGETQVKTEGVNGIKTLTSKVTYEDGVKKSSEVVSEEITKAPITEVVAVGTKSAVVTKEETSEKAVAYETKKVDNADMDKGTTKVSTQGQNGVMLITDKVTYTDGVETARETIDQTVTKDPITEVIQVGVKEKVEVPAPTPTPEVKPTPEVTPTPVEPEEQPAAGNGGHATESIKDSEFDLICAIVAHEGGTSYEGSLAVISCVMNRVDAGNWGGSSALGVLTAPGQFASYLDGYYTQYMGAAIPEVRQAVRDCMEGGTRSHEYMSFRSYQTSGSVNICGNWYF